MSGSAIVALALVGVSARFGVELLGEILPHARYHYYEEQTVVFARAGLYRPHGVAVVAGTGATAWAVRADDGRECVYGGWGSLLGDEGSGYALGLAGLRAAIRVFEGRAEASSRLFRLSSGTSALRNRPSGRIWFSWRTINRSPEPRSRRWQRW